MTADDTGAPENPSTDRPDTDQADIDQLPGTDTVPDPAAAEAVAAVPDSGDEAAGEALSVVLVGPPGAGKSTIGRKLARELGLELFDTDAGIEEQTGRSIPEIFAEDGEPEFRRIEEDVVREAVLAGRGIVSLGGGSVLSGATRELLRGRTVVYLEISVGEGLRRTGASTNRPLLAGDDPAKKYRELMKIRRPLYREVASVRVRTDGRSPGRVVRMIMAKLGVESILPHEDPTPTPPPADQPTTSKSRSRRRRRRGRGDRAGATLMPKSPAAEPDSTARTTAEATTTDPASADTPKRARRNRRSRRRGLGTQAVATAANGTTIRAAAPGTTTAATARGATTTNGTTAAPDTAAANGANVAEVATTPPSGDRSRRRRASRSAGSPTASANGHGTAPATTTAPQPASANTAASTRDNAVSTPVAQQDSPPAGQPAAPGAGRSRRARARRAKARARDQSAEHSGTTSPAAPAQPRQVEAEADS